jgi:hypothetical protein
LVARLLARAARAGPGRGIWPGIADGAKPIVFGPGVGQAAMLCRKAGADPEAIPAWIAEGRRRRAAANQPPFSGGLHGGSPK